MNLEFEPRDRPVGQRATFTLLHTDGAARAGVVQTARGSIETPIFMPVGTSGTVKGISSDELEALGAQIILANTYHLYLRPGVSSLRALGGVHKLANWKGPLLTDSGGYQFFSLSKLARFDDDGVDFRSHLDGSKHRFTPELAIAVQDAIGSDIAMVLDQCPALPATQQVLEQAVRRSTAWAMRCRDAAADTGCAVFAIAQGGTNVALRRAHVEELIAGDFDGYALGGLAVGEAPEEMYETIGEVVPHMRRDRARYLMGVGRPIDLLEAVDRGIDMFDCVMPTRNARNAQVFTRRGKLNLRNARFGLDSEPIDDGCTCPACANYSRAWIHHMLRGGEMLALRLTTLHNLRYYLDLIKAARRAIVEGRYAAFRRETEAAWREYGQ